MYVWIKGILLLLGNQEGREHGRDWESRVEAAVLQEFRSFMEETDMAFITHYAR